MSNLLRRIKKSKRQIDWREVRVGFARPVEQKEKRTFVARMGQYPEVVQQLKSAAVDQGLSIYTLVYGLADGGNGLREALEAEFSHFQFILDRPHLKQHLYATAEAMELTGQMRFLWLKYTLDLIDHGQVKRVISRLKYWQGKGQNPDFSQAVEKCSKKRRESRMFRRKLKPLELETQILEKMTTKNSNRGKINSI